MKLIDRYIFVTVIILVLGVIGVIVGLDVIFSYVAELEDVEGDYQARDALWYVICTAPRRIVEFIPFGSLIGALLAMGSLAASSELIVMRAAGISTYRLVFSSAIPVLVVVFTGMIMSEFLIPATEHYAEGYRAVRTGEGGVGDSRVGYWYREGNTFIKVNAILPDGAMVGVTRFQFDHKGRRLERVSVARQAVFIDGYWVLQGLQESRLEDSRVTAQAVTAEPWFASLKPELLKVVSIDPDYLSIIALHRYIDYLNTQNLQTQRYELSYWKKIWQPFTSLALAFVAVSFVFGPLRSVTMGLRLTAGAVVGLLFFYAQQMLGFLSLVYPVPPLLAASLPAAVCLGIGCLLLQRVR